MAVRIITKQIALTPAVCEFIELDDSSERRITVVIAPGPAINGIANGKVASDDKATSLIAFSAVAFLLFCLFSNTI